MKFARNPLHDYGKPSAPKDNPSFSEYFAQVGEKPPATIVEDGNIHRYGTKKHRWYVFTKGSDGWDHGAFGDWSTGNTYTWTSRGSGARLTPKQIAAIEEQISKSISLHYHLMIHSLRRISVRSLTKYSNVINQLRLQKFLIN